MVSPATKQQVMRRLCLYYTVWHITGLAQLATALLAGHAIIAAAAAAAAACGTPLGRAPAY
jgi:hypothetical protein